MALTLLLVGLDIRYGKSPIAVATELANALVSQMRGAWVLATGGEEFRNRHEASKRRIRENHNIPDMDGSVDIYSYDQAAVFAHGLEWNPRPIFQSYSAYRPRLASLNSMHVSGPHAPDHILFSIQPIDGRLPSLEDGASWIPIFQRYELRERGQWLVLDRAAVIRPVSVLAIARFDSKGWLELPAENLLYVASIALGESQATSVPWRPAFHFIELIMGDDRRLRRYRFFPAPFGQQLPLSPHVETTEDFSLLLEGCIANLGARKVRAIRILDSHLEPVPFSIDLFRVDIGGIEGVNPQPKRCVVR